MIKDIEKLSMEILQIVTARFVGTGRTIPAEILALKDETMQIYDKSRHETDPAELEKFDKRLKEIRGQLVTGA